MNKIKLSLFAAVLSIVVTGLCPSNLNAQQIHSWTPANVFLAAGSSGQFNATGVGALWNVYNGNTPCTGGDNTLHWTSSGTLNSAGMQVHDPRTALVNDEVGTVWIGWDSYFIQGMDYNFGRNGVVTPPGAGQGTVCAYVSLDSTLGTRLYFAYGQMVLNTTTAGTPDGAKVPLIPGGVGLPQEVIDYFDNMTGVSPDHAGVHPTMNVGPTDILPADTKFAEVRAETTYGTQMYGAGYPGLGYGGITCGTAGSQIKSAVSGAYFDVIDFVMDPGDIDCFTGAAPRGYQLISVGADPVIIVANNTNTASGHLGDPAFWAGPDPQIGQQVAANVFSGLNEDVGSITGVYPSSPLHTFNREPLSGTYNTFDWNVTCTVERYPNLSFIGNAYNCQETGVNPGSCPSPGVNCGNPFVHTDASNGYTRKRVIGTGEMVSTVCTNADGIGYAFWGFSTFSGRNSCMHYLPVDNIDPLYSYPSANPGGIGFLPQCASLPCLPPFTKIKTGAYPIWTIYRWVADPGPYGSFYQNVLAYLQAVAANDLGEFVPLSQMTSFRSHFTQLVRTNGTATYPSNGVASPNFNPAVGGQEPEQGGDMGGQVFTINSEVNYVNDAITNGTCTWITITDKSCEQLQWHR